jgi:AcrR family transcriptional regulator
MPEAAPRVGNRRHSSLSNDERILDAALAELIDHGPDGFTLRDVAKRVGLSHTAVYSRYDDRDELLADLWDRRSAADLARLVATVGDATTRPGCLGGEGHVVAEPRVRAALELCVAAHRCADLGDVVPAAVMSMCTDAGLIRHGGVVDTVGMGFLVLQVGTSLTGPLRPAVYREATGVAAALDAGSQEWRGPAPRPVIASFAVPGHDSPLRDRLVAAAAMVISRSGIERATVKRIARVAGCSASALYTVFESREALLADLASRHAIDGDAPMRGLGAVGASEVPAALIAGWSHPRSGVRRRTLIEMYATTPHHDTMRATMIAAIEAIAEEQVESLGGPTNPWLRTVLSVGETLTAGVAVLADVLAPGGVDLSVCDWRPFMASLHRGYRIQAC